MKSGITIMAAVLIVVGMSLGSCERNGYADENRVRLEFSADTLSFDTVFAAMGTAVHQLKVYNRSSEDVEISLVTLKHGRQSRFRLNVDGDTSMVARRVEVQSGDSIFIFVQANINPNATTEPFLCTDSIVFGNGQIVPIVAYGRNAVYHTLGAGDGWFSRIDCDNWDHTRPHVFLAPAAVMEGNKLSLTAGDELYFADGAALIIDSMATLDARGTEEKPIRFSSMRQEEWYRHLPGQWLFVWLYNGSINNVIDHAVIENGTAGLRCYPESDISISNTEICQMSDAGIVGQNATVRGKNLLVYDCYSALALIGGGDYQFGQSTFVDYWNYRGKSRDTSAVILSNYYPLPDGTYTGNDMRRALFSECIIYGCRQKEVSIISMPPLEMNYSFVRSIVRGGEWDEDPMFEDIEEDNYRTSDESPASGIGYTYPTLSDSE